MKNTKPKHEYLIKPCTSGLWCAMCLTCLPVARIDTKSMTQIDAWKAEHDAKPVVGSAG